MIGRVSIQTVLIVLVIVVLIVLLLPHIHVN